MKQSAIRKKIFDFINTCFIMKSEFNFDDDTLLLENDIIDSTGVIELVSFIEETFAISVEDEEIIPENLDSINKIVKFIEQKDKPVISAN